MIRSTRTILDILDLPLNSPQEMVCRRGWQRRFAPSLRWTSALRALLSRPYQVLVPGECCLELVLAVARAARQRLRATCLPVKAAPAGSPVLAM